MIERIDRFNESEQLQKNNACDFYSFLILDLNHKTCKKSEKFFHVSVTISSSTPQSSKLPSGKYRRMMIGIFLALKYVTKYASKNYQGSKGMVRGSSAKNKISIMSMMREILLINARSVYIHSIFEPKSKIIRG